MSNLIAFEREGNPDSLLVTAVFSLMKSQGKTFWTGIPDSWVTTSLHAHLEMFTLPDSPPS